MLITSSVMKNGARPWALLVVQLAVVLALGACGDSDDSPVASDGTQTDQSDDDHAHDDTHIETFGRLAVQEGDVASVRLIELDNASVIATIPTKSPVSGLYASPDRRYAVAIQRTDDRVEFIDGGLWQEDHGDHLHDYRADPSLLSFSLDGVRPTHFETHDELAALFNDGLGDPEVPATVSMLSDPSIGAGRVEANLNLDIAMHGTAEPRGTYLVTTKRQAGSESVLPNKVVLYKFSAGAYEFVEEFEPECPLLHGSYSNETHSVFGCGDGVLVVEQNGDTFTASKIENPASMPADARIGTVSGHHGRSTFVGIARPNLLFEIDPASGQMTAIAWPGQTRVTSAFDHEGRHLLVMDEAGSVHLLDGSNAWVSRGVVPAASGIPESGSSPAMVAHGNEDIVYVSDPTGRRIVAIDTGAAAVVSTISLDFAPGQLTWLGIGEHEHEHDE